MSSVSDRIQLVPPPPGPLQSIDGIILQVDYQARRMTLLVAERRWDCLAAASCSFWIENRRVLFRCYRPQDHVRILYRDCNRKNLAEEMHMGRPSDAADVAP